MKKKREENDEEKGGRRKEEVSLFLLSTAYFCHSPFIMFKLYIINCSFYGIFFHNLASLE